MNLAKRLKINPKISRLNRDAYKLITDESELVRVCDEIRKTDLFPSIWKQQISMHWKPNYPHITLLVGR